MQREAPLGSVSGLILLCPASLGRSFKYEMEGPIAPRGSALKSSPNPPPLIP